MPVRERGDRDRVDSSSSLFYIVHALLKLMDADADTLYQSELDAARAVTENPEASEKAQRSALARIRRLRGRSPERGVSAFDFDAVPVLALRMYYSSTTFRVDTANDNALARFYGDPFIYQQSDLPAHAALMNRPHYLVKANLQLASASNVDSQNTPFHMMRRSRYRMANGREALPFESDDALILFDDMTGRPMFRAKIVSITMSDTQDDPASGGVVLALTPMENKI